MVYMIKENVKANFFVDKILIYFNPPLARVVGSVELPIFPILILAE